MSTVSPWVKIATPKADSLKDVMSEQLADELQEEEIKTLQDDQDNQIIASSNNITATIEDTAENDYVLASLLQLEFDKEYDEVLKKYENQRNRNSKGKQKIN
jgi:RIO kinase 3